MSLSLKIKDHYKNISSINQEGLSLFRVFAGINISIACAFLLSIAHPFLAPTRIGTKSILSIIDLMPSIFCVKILLALGIVSGICLAANIRPKLNVFFACLLYTGLYIKTPFFIFGGDIALFICLLWFLLLKNPLTNSTSQRIPIIAMRLQIAFVYFGSVISKFSDSYWLMGDSFLLNLTSFLWSSHLGKVVASITPYWIGQGATYLAIIFETLLLPALLLPFFQPFILRTAVILLIIFHFFTALFFNIGTFPFVMIGLLIFLLDNNAQKSIYNFFYKTKSKLLPFNDITSFYNSIKKLAHYGLIFLLAATFIMESWNALAGLKVHSLWINYPWRNKIVRVAGYDQFWSMFTLSDKVKSREEKKERSITTGLVIVMIYDEKRGLIDPISGGHRTWSHAFLSRQDRNAWLTKALNVPHYNENQWYRKISIYYGNMAKKKWDAKPIQAAIYHYTTNLKMPKDAWDTYADLNREMTFDVRLLATVDLDEKMKPSNIVKSEDSSPITIKDPFFRMQ